MQQRKIDGNDIGASRDISIDPVGILPSGRRTCKDVHHTSQQVANLQRQGRTAAPPKKV